MPRPLMRLVPLPGVHELPYALVGGAMGGCMYGLVGVCVGGEALGESGWLGGRKSGYG